MKFEIKTKNKSILFFAISLLLNISVLVGQPSGGPYGPIDQKYELPNVDGKIFYVGVDGKAENDGLSLENLTTVERAVASVVTGDAIVLRGGIYRIGNLELNQGITIQPFESEKVIFKGTFIAKDWTDLGNGLWTTIWKNLFPSRPDNWWRRHREGKKTPQHRFNNDMVFVDGKFLQSAGWEGEVDENTFFIDYETGTVYIGTNPTEKLIEITAFNSAIVRTINEVHGKKSDRKGYTLRGITFTQYAYRALEVEGKYPEELSDESNHGKDVIGTTIEHCTISFCSRVASYLKGDSLTIRNCKVSDTSTEGIYIISSNDVLLEKNIFTRNNIERITGYYPAAVKIFNQCYRVTCNDNLVIDHPYSNGIWYDVGNVDGVFTNNWVQGVGKIENSFRTDQLWPSDNGFFFEISKGAVCAGNVFVDCDHGVMVLNASDVLIYNNTFVNSMVCIGRNERSAQGDHFGWHPSTGPDVDERVGHAFVNNLLTGDDQFNRSLLFLWQREIICESIKDPQLKELDNNVYVRGIENTTYPMILWGPAETENCQYQFSNLVELRKVHPNFAQNSSNYFNYAGPLFKGKALGNYQLVADFPELKSGKPVPTEISKLIRPIWKKDNHIGAYPIMP